MSFTLSANLRISPPTNINSIVSNINKQLGKINGSIGLNLPANTQRQLAGVSSQMKTLGNVTRTTQGYIESLGTSTAASLRRFFGFTVFASSFFTLTKAIRSSLGEAIDFQRELIKIRQVTGTSLKDLKGLTDEVTRLSTTLGISSNKLLNVAQILAQAGLAADDTTIALEALAKTEVAPTFEDIHDTTEGAIAIMAQFKLGVKDLDHAFGSLNAVAGKFAVESSDIITAVRRTGGVFAAAGGSLNDLIALFTSVRQTTRESAETISTGFRTIFTRLQRTRTIDFLEKLGIQLRDSEKQFIGPYEAIRKLSSALNQIPSTDVRFAQITEELGGFRQIGKVIPLIKEFTIAEQARIVAERGVNSLTDDTAKSQDALALKIMRVKEEFQALIRTFAGSSEFNTLINTGLKLASTMIKIAESIKPIVPLIAAISAAKIGTLGPRYFSSLGKGLGFASGGKVGGSGIGDTVPAMLTPGEFVINKQAVSRIGIKTLRKLNDSGISKFAKGGPVSSTAGSIGLGIAIAPALLTQFDKLNDATKDLVNFGTQLTSTFLALNLSLKAFQNTIDSPKAKLEKLQPKQEALKKNFTRGNFELKHVFKELTDANKNLFDSNTRKNSLETKLIINRGIINNPALSPTRRNEAQQDFDITSVRYRQENKNNKVLSDISSELGKKLSTNYDSQSSTLRRLNHINKEIVALERSEKALNIMNAGISLAAAGLIAFGGLLEKEANTQLQAGFSGGKNKLATARSLSGAGQGIGIGASAGIAIGLAHGPAAPIAIPVLAVLGGLVGGLKSFHDALEEATNILEQGQFEKNIKSFDDIIKNVQGGKSTPLSQISGFRGGINSLQSRLLNAPLTEKESIEGKIQNSVVGIENFLVEITKTVKSFDELKQVVGVDLLQRFAQFANLPFDTIKKNFEKQIQSQNELVIQTKLLSSAQENQFKRIQLFGQLSSALQDSIDGLTSFSDVLDNTKIKDLSGVFSRVGSISDKNLLKTAVGQVSGPFGKQGADLGAEFLKTAEVLSALPNIIIESTSKTFEESREFIDDFEDTLRRQFPDIAEALVTSFKANIAKFRGPEAKDAKLYGTIQQNPGQFLKEISGGILEAEQKFFEDNSKLLTQQLNDLAGLYEKRRQLESRLIDGLNASVNLQEQKATFGFESRGKILPLAQAEGFEQTRLRNIGGFGGVEVAGASALNSQQNIVKINQKLQNEAADRTSLLEELEKEKDALKKSTSILEFFADVTSRAASDIRELDLVQKRQQSKFDFAKSFVFGDLESRRGLGRSALGGGLLARTGDINKVPGGLRGDVLSFLEKFEDVPLAFLKGKTGKEVIRDTVAKELTPFVGKDEAERLALSKTTPAEQKIIDAINKKFDNAILAQGKLNILGETTNSLLKDIKANTSGFKLILEKNQLNVQKESKTGELLGTTGQIKDLRNQQDSFKKITSIIGGNADTFTNVRTALPQLIGLKESKEKALAESKRLAPLGKIISGRNLNDINQRFPALSSIFNRFNFGKQGLEHKFSEEELGGLKKVFSDEFTGFGPELGEQIFNNDFYKKIDIGKTTLNQLLDIVVDRAKELQKNSFADLQGVGDEQRKLGRQLGFGDRGAGQIDVLFKDLGRLNELFKSIPQEVNFEGLSNINKSAGELSAIVLKLKTEIDALSKRIAEIDAAKGLASGGFISGTGNTDSVSAMLMPGEFVINKRAAQSIGYDELEDMNAIGFASGGKTTRKQILDQRKAANSARKQSLRDDRKTIRENYNKKRAISRGPRIASAAVPAGGKGLQGKAAREFFAAEKERALTGIKERSVIPELFGTNRKGLQGPAARQYFENEKKAALNRINKSKSSIKFGSIPHFATGGIVNGNSGGIAPEAIESLSRFGENINRLSSSLDNFPRTVEMSVRHTIEVIHNGAQVFQSLNEQFTILAEATVSRELNKMLKTKFPDVGSI